jgi:hypothetical protein
MPQARGILGRLPRLEIRAVEQVGALERDRARYRRPRRRDHLRGRRRRRPDSRPGTQGASRGPTLHRRSRMDAPVGARPECLVRRRLAVRALIRSHLWQQKQREAVPWFKAIAGSDANRPRAYANGEDLPPSMCNNSTEVKRSSHDIEPVPAGRARPRCRGEATCPERTPVKARSRAIRRQGSSARCRPSALRPRRRGGRRPT